MLTQGGITLPQYNICPLRPPVEEQEGDELPLVVERRAARHQPCHETRKARLKQYFDELTELVSTLVVALDQNAAIVAPTIPPRILLANTESEETWPPQEGRDATTSEARTDTSMHQMRAWRRCQNVTQIVHGDHEPTLESRQIEHTRDSIFNRLERLVANPNLDDDYDFEYEHSAGSRGSADLRGRLNAR